MTGCFFGVSEAAVEICRLIQPATFQVECRSLSFSGFLNALIIALVNIENRVLGVLNTLTIIGSPKDLRIGSSFGFCSRASDGSRVAELVSSQQCLLGQGFAIWPAACVNPMSCTEATGTCVASTAPKGPNPKSETLNPKAQTLNPQPSTLT